MKNIKFISSPNWFSRRGYNPEMLVIHINEGLFNGTIEWFKNTKSQVSAHYVISRTGKIVQMVKEKNASWDVGVVNNPTERGLSVLKKLNGKFVNPNFYSIGIENEAKATHLWTQHWTEPQMQALTSLVRDVCDRNGISYKNIVTHHDIANYKPNMDKWLEELKQGLEYKNKLLTSEILILRLLVKLYMKILKLLKAKYAKRNI